jgi:poly(A)-specific ribonuclease
MDVTIDNFEAVLKELETLVPLSDFVAIDMEFTGLSETKKMDHANSDHFSTSIPMESAEQMNQENGEEAIQNKIKELEEKYEEVRTASNFLVIQVGVCPFTWSEKSSEFIAHPFNFYTFPREFRGHDPRFLCQTSSMSFLAEKGHFDFNKLIRSGIPFLSHEQEANVKSKGAMDPDGFVLELREQIISFLVAGEPATLQLPPADSYRRKLTYQELASTFKDMIITDRQCSESGDVSIRVSRVKNWNRALGSTVAQV